LSDLNGSTRREVVCGAYGSPARADLAGSRALGWQIGLGLSDSHRGREGGGMNTLEPLLNIGKGDVGGDFQGFGVYSVWPQFPSSYFIAGSSLKRFIIGPVPYLPRIGAEGAGTCE
jgi:hypothetical protein